jgi:anti-sigma B factor antagonist
MVEFSVNHFDNDIVEVKINGRLDIQGVGSIETAFTVQAAGQKSKVIVDLSGVDFMSSIGIRLLVTASKAQLSRGGSLVLLSPQPLVREIIVVSGIDMLIPIYDNFDDASKHAVAM